MSEPAKARMPRQIPFIIANEGCERFSFYGMRNILQTFLPTSIMLLHLPEAAREGAAKDVFHTFAMGVYFFPLLGGYLADRFFGKFNTILWFSLIYCAGHGLLALFIDNAAGFYSGLFLIALGAGGIKPLVASFMGDQFDSRNKHLAKLVFDAFYWIINFGSFFASMIMPALLKERGPEIAFGIPGALMLVATTVFWAGSKKYVRVAVPPPNPNSFIRVMKTSLFTGSTGPGKIIALVGWACAAATLALWPMGWLKPAPTLALSFVLVLAASCVGTSFQLDRARSVHGDSAVEGVRAVLRVLVVFALVTPFHSLFDQKATVWVIQGKAMASPGWAIDFGFFEMSFLPGQMQLFNPLLVMLLIPLNNLVLYPFMRRLGYEATSLRRMTWGIVFSGLAWLIVGAIQLQMDGGNKLVIFWQILPYIVLTFGEVLVSATGLEFAYSQAPLAMKGTIMSFWNLTTTVGNLWVLLVDAAVRNKTVTEGIHSSGMSEQAFLMFFFAGFALVIAVVFWLNARRYRMVDNYRSTQKPDSAAAAVSPLPEARDVSSVTDAKNE